MCGVYGFLGKPTKGTPNIISRLGNLNQSRGTDSTGVAIITGADALVIKDITPAKKFYERNLGKVQKELRKAEFANIIGHTRLATRGAVTQENAHPFITSNIIFSHNGWVSNFDELQTKYDTTYQVDSQMIGHVLARETERKAFNDVLSGQFTVPYTRLDNPRILKVVTHGSPFSFAITSNGLYYSSELDHLEKALKGWKALYFDSMKSELYRFRSLGKEIAWETRKISPPATVYYNYGYNYSYGNARKDYRDWFNTAKACLTSKN